jgi:cell division protein FtsB
MRSTFLAVLFIGFQYIPWLGDNSIPAVLTLNRNIQLQQEKNRQLISNNLRLKREINALQQQPIQADSLVEDYARWKLGFVKQGEWFCRW